MYVVDVNDEEMYLSKKTGCPLEDAHDYMLVQECYLDMMGLIVCDDEEPKEADDTIIYDEKKCEFISRLTGLDLELCEQLSLADLDYLTEHGVAVELPAEYDEELNRVIGTLDPHQRCEVLAMIRKLYHI